MMMRISWSMRASGMVIAAFGAGAIWMATVFGLEFWSLFSLTPLDPLRMNDWRGWFAILVGLFTSPFMLYAGGRLMFSSTIPEPDISPNAVKRKGAIVVSLVVAAAALGLGVQQVGETSIERLGWEQCYVKQTSWRFGKELYSQSCEAHGLMKLDQALEKLSLDALRDKLNKEMFD